MTEKEFRKLNRIELLKLLLEMSREKERLEQELAEANAKLEEKRILIESSGSIAEAALKLNGIFEAAQRTADQYLASVAAAALDGKKLRSL